MPQLPVDSACVQSIEKPSYPQLARRFASQGTVTVHFTIAEDGKVRNPVYEGNEGFTPDGNNTLTAEVRSILDRTQIDPQCKGDFDLVYRFVLDTQKSTEPNTTVAFNSPNEFVVKANRDLLTCSVYSIEKPSWRKRLFSRLRGRGQPSTIQTLECY